jgi:hypothetical protein
MDRNTILELSAYTLSTIAGFVKPINDTWKYFMEYSGGSINAYYFGDLFENKHEKEKRFTELKESLGANKNELIEKIVSINMD